MAIFHMRAQVISRSAGRSAIAAAAYRAGERLRDDRTGQMHDYSRKAFVEHREIMAPGTAPAWMRDRAALWSAVETAEKRKDAQLAREVHFALPRELDRTQRVELIRDFCRREFVERGMIADVTIHNPPDRAGAEQPHAHVMLTTRVLTDDGFGQKDRGWNDKTLYESWREGWAEHANRALERVGSGERIDHRSFAERGIDREPEPKLGPKAARLERAEMQAAANENRPAVPVTERGQEWQAVRDRNQDREQFRSRLDATIRELREVASQVIAEARERFEATWQRMERVMIGIRDRLTPGRPDGTLLSAQPSREQLLGRTGLGASDRDGQTSGQPASERDALLGKAFGSAERAPPPVADLLGRGLIQPVAPPGRDKGGDRER